MLNPWLLMAKGLMPAGDAQAAPPEAFPGRMVGAQPPPAAAAPQPPAWTPQIAQPLDFNGPPQPPPNELAAAQASIDQQARERAALEQMAPPADQAGAPPPAGAATSLVSRGTSQTKTPGGPSLQDMIANLNSRELKSLEQQGLSVDKLKASLAKMEGQELPMDLTGLAALTDAWSGSHFVDAYRPPETLKDRRAAVEKLQAQIAQSEQGLSENEISLLRSQLNSQFQLENLNATEAQRKEQNQIEWAKLANDKAKLAKTNGLKPMDAFQIRNTIDKSDTTKAVRGNIELANALNNYEKLVNKYGSTPGGVPSGELDNAYSAITLAYKNAGELGALSGPDMGIVEQGIRNGGSISGWLKNGVKGGDEGIKAQIRAMRSATKGGFDRRMQSMHELVKGYEPVAGDYIGAFDQQMNQALGTAPLDEQAAAMAWAKANPKDPRAAKILQHASGGK